MYDPAIAEKSSQLLSLNGFCDKLSLYKFRQIGGMVK